MPAPALIISKTSGPPAPEKVLVLNTRSGMGYPFEATNWTDLRVGFLLSLTQTLADDVPVPPPPMIDSLPGPAPFTDYYFIGVADRATGLTFMGYSNVNPSRPNGTSAGDSMLVSSDGGIGTSNAFFWRPKNSLSDTFSAIITDGNEFRTRAGDGTQLHFAQVPASAGGYATLVALRLQRDSGTSRTISMSVKRDTVNHKGDVVFTNDPSALLLKSYLSDFPTTVAQLGPIPVGHAPDTLFLYWPFPKTRLRCHVCGFLKKA